MPVSGETGGNACEEVHLRRGYVEPAAEDTLEGHFRIHYIHSGF